MERREVEDVKPDSKRRQVIGTDDCCRDPIDRAWARRGPCRASVQDFLLGGGTLWPPAASDFLYSETEFFVLSDFGFLASLLLRI
jgi:hypothetical protein